MCKREPGEPLGTRAVVRAGRCVRSPPVALRRVVPDRALARLARRAESVGGGSVRHLVASVASAYAAPIPAGADPEPIVRALAAWCGSDRVSLEAPPLPPPSFAPSPAPALSSRPGVPPGVPPADGSGVAFVDLEWGFAEHEALPPIEVSCGVSRGWWWHGTAVFGVIVGQNERARGIAPRARARFASPWAADGRYEVAAAITVAAASLEPGDVLLLEVQGRSHGGAAPAEVDPVVRDVIALARLAGVLTVEAAGNGGQSLDGTPVGAAGALVVGAIDPDTGSRHPRSGWGDAVTACGWGEHVHTAWSNPLGTARDLYTPSFSGTSAAAAIVAGIAIAAQSYAKARGRTVLPDEMRALLSTRGSAVAGVGVQPDLEAVLAAL